MLRLTVCCLVLTLLCAGQGCNYFNSTEPEVSIDEPDWADEDGSSGTDSQSASVDPDADAITDLELQLKAGERFGMRKIVETQLDQTAPDGTHQIVNSTITLTLGLTVEDVRDRRTKMAVRYNRVQVQHRESGKSYIYDSQANSRGEPVPVGFRAYHNMINDGFSFWIGRENQIESVEGFKEFLDRCIADIPTEQQRAVLLNMEASADENGLSDFVDNTIGLLPYGRAISPGDDWEHVRHIGRPVPMHVATKYTLTDVTDAEAVVDIRGEITKSVSTNDPSSELGASVIVQGGSLKGECTIYRDSGLPKTSRVERVVDMTVVISTGHSFNQTKTVTTTVEAYPDQSGAKPILLGEGDTAQAGPAILPATNRELR